MSAADSVSNVRPSLSVSEVSVSQAQPQMPPVPAPAEAVAAPLTGSAADITEPVAAAKKKKKKKRHKEPAVALPDPGGASAAAPGHFSPLVAVSLGLQIPKYQAFLFAMPACQAFSAEDRELARTMFSEWPLSSQMCWIDILGATLMKNWNELLVATQNSEPLSSVLTSMQESFLAVF